MMLHSVAVVDCGNTTLHWDAKREAKNIKARQDSGKDARLLITGGAGHINPSENSIQIKKRSKVTAKAKNFQHAHRKTIKEIQNKIEQECETQRFKEEHAKIQRERVKPKNIASATSRIFGEGKLVPKISDQSSNARRVSSSSSDGGGDVSTDSNISSITSISKSTKKFVEKNKTIAPQPIKLPIDPEKSNMTSRRHSSYGKVPAYIRSRRADEAEAERLLALEKESDCPKGMIEMPDSERIETLRRLVQVSDDLRFQLARLPIANRSMRTEAKREQLEKELLENEQSQVIFSRKKVYTIIDDR